MTWRIEFTVQAARDMRRLGHGERARILDFLENRVAPLEQPRQLAKRLSGSDEEIWRFRVGNYRILSRIDDETISVLVLAAGHRSRIYR